MVIKNAKFSCFAFTHTYFVVCVLFSLVDGRSLQFVSFQKSLCEVHLNVKFKSVHFLAFLVNLHTKTHKIILHILFSEVNKLVLVNTFQITRLSLFAYFLDAYHAKDFWTVG